MSRRGTQCSSRASSRKSSRASDASDISELAGPWLNLPLMMVSGADDVVSNIKQQSEELGKRYLFFKNYSFEILLKEILPVFDENSNFCCLILLINFFNVLFSKKKIENKFY